MAPRPRDLSAKVNPRNGRYRLISGNWKMNLNHLEAISSAQKLFYLLRDADFHFAEISLHPPFTDLRSLQLLFESDRIPMSLGAQNCGMELSGAFTGEVSATMLARLSVKYVIVGHSERRDLFGEDNVTVATKLRTVLSAGMIPILCVGESDTERQMGQTQGVVAEMVTSALRGVSPTAVEKVVIAYEPKWAIGSGNPASPDDAAAAARIIRGAVDEVSSPEVSQRVRVQYGGSVNGSNAAAFMELAEIDGLLVGGASLDPEAFARVIQA